MAKSKEKTQKIAGHLRSTDRGTYRMLTSEDDPHYALHTMAFSMRNVPTKKKPTDEEA